MHVAGVIEETLDDEVFVRRHDPERRLTCREILDELLGDGLADPDLLSNPARRRSDSALVGDDSTGVVVPLGTGCAGLRLTSPFSCRRVGLWLATACSGGCGRVLQQLFPDTRPQPRHRGR